MCDFYRKLRAGIGLSFISSPRSSGYGAEMPLSGERGFFVQFIGLSEMIRFHTFFEERF